MNNISSKAIAGILTLFVLIGILVTGPVNALNLGIVLPENNVIVGTQTDILINAEINEEEAFADKFMIDFSGPISFSCLFYSNGTKISSCNGMDIEVLSLPNISNDGYGYGYCNGYGYGYTCGATGNYSYRIVLNTTNYPAGIYQSQIIAFSGSDTTSENGPSLTLSNEPATINSCSVRAEEGELTLNGTDLDGKGRLSFFIPKQGAVKGKGTLIAQQGKERLSYDFDIKQILSNNADAAIISVAGTYRINRGSVVVENAILYLDKKNGLVDVVGESIDAEQMEVKFMKGCM